MSELFAEMALDLRQHRDSPERTLVAIVEWTQWAADCSGAGIMLVGPDDTVHTPVATSPSIYRAHELQVEFGEGPCLDVILEGAENYITQDAAADGRFPRWGPAVAELGFNSVIAVLLGTEDHRYGSLNLYGEEKHAFDVDALAMAEIFARHATVAWIGANESRELHVELDARKLIGQAQGILMEKFDLDADRSFAVLRRFSQTQNVKLRQVAELVIENGALPHLEP